MKLRIRGNSVRIRLSQTELTQLAEEGVAEDRVRFSAEASLAYRVRVAPAGSVRAELGADGLTVTLPKATLERWLAPDEVSIRAEQPIDGRDALKILVEKDFACLVPREGEDDSDLFPNPARRAC
ncbi:MAG TPA: hypothetical protein VF339_03365 [Gammaproteobacteria bacterium]